MAERSQQILTAAGIGLGAVLLVEGGRRFQEMVLKQMARIDAFEEELGILVKAAARENRLDTFAMPINLGNRLLDAAVATKLRNNSLRGRIGLNYIFEAYGVSSASAHPMTDYEGLWVRRMGRGFSGTGFRWDIVGASTMFDFNPQKYKPGPDVLV